MRLIMLGAPGAGKGTQAVQIAERKNIPHISTGDIFRYNIKNNTELGIKAKQYINKGLLVPDDLTVEIIKTRIIEDDCKNGFVLDGYPRTINQAEVLEEVLKQIGTKIDCVLDIEVPDEVIVKRLSGRRICSKCNEGYHLLYNAPKNENICNLCGAELTQRDDDKEETVLNRLKTYHTQTEPLIVFYKEKGKLITIEGRNSIQETTNEVYKALGIELCI